jgi:NAD(P)-dependent dehydrogenase (short-subunit alcohol dehydrogenase family)
MSSTITIDRDIQTLLDYVPPAHALKDKVILLTGAGDGLGAVLAKTYARFGATVILLGKTPKKLERVYDEIVAAGHPEPIIHALDMVGAGADDYRNMVNAIASQLGQLNGVVLNAAWLPVFTPFKHYEADLWHKVIMSGLQANYLLLHACLPVLEKSQNPSILFSAHESNKAYFGAFGVAKGGMEAMLDIIADEYDQAEHFIRVNRIDTNCLRTRMRTSNFPGEEPDTMARPEAVLGAYLYFMTDDSLHETKREIRLPRLSGQATWAGE